MTTTSQSQISQWQAAAAQKRKAVNDLIPSEWILPRSLPSAQEQQDVTGDYIRQFLTESEIQYTEAAASAILQSIHAGRWKAYEVLRAFCHRAALAHQMVSTGQSYLHRTHISA